MKHKLNKVVLSFNAHPDDAEAWNAGVEFAEVYWQHLGGGFQKDPQVQSDLSEFLVKKF
jgi:hypothetical protein